MPGVDPGRYNDVRAGRSARESQFGGTHALIGKSMLRCRSITVTKHVPEVVYDPDLNDGVVLNITPLHEFVPWKETKNYWEELLEGKYEWSSMGKLLRKKGIVK